MAFIERERKKSNGESKKKAISDNVITQETRATNTSTRKMTHEATSQLVRGLRIEDEEDEEEYDSLPHCFEESLREYQLANGIKPPEARVSQF